MAKCKKCKSTRQLVGTERTKPTSTPNICLKCCTAYPSSTKVLKQKKKLPAAYLKECFKVIDNRLVWRERPSAHFTTYRTMKNTNEQFAGRTVTSETVNIKGFKFQVSDLIEKLK